MKATKQLCLELTDRRSQGTYELLAFVEFMGQTQRLGIFSYPVDLHAQLCTFLEFMGDSAWRSAKYEIVSFAEAHIGEYKKFLALPDFKENTRLSSRYASKLRNLVDNGGL